MAKPNPPIPQRTLFPEIAAEPMRLATGVPMESQANQTADRLPSFAPTAHKSQQKGQPVHPSVVESTIIPDELSIHELKKRILELEILAPEQWAEAIAQLDRDINRLSGYELLMGLKAIRIADPCSTSGSIPALTDFQVQQIMNGNIERLRVDHYLILKRLGAGGMGEVFLVRNLDLNRVEAMKTIFRERVLESSEGASSNLSVVHRRFHREARILAKLNHPNVTTVFGTGCVGDIDFITMEFLEGNDLLHVLREECKHKRLLSFEKVVDFIIATAEGLRHAHERGIIHRDIKPQNLMLTKEGQLKILDMGIARLYQVKNPEDSQNTYQTMTKQGSPLGTPAFMPPEQWFDATKVAPSADIYSLGCTFHFLLTAKTPFDTQKIDELVRAHLSEMPPRISELRPGLPPELDDILYKMMAKKPEDRYQTMEELIHELRLLHPVQSQSQSQSGVRQTIRKEWLEKEESQMVISWYLVILFSMVLTMVIGLSAVWLLSGPISNNGTVKQTLTATWMPADYIPPADARLVKCVDGNFYDRLHHERVAGLVLLLIPYKPDDLPSSKPLYSYYISQDKITSKIYAVFLEHLSESEPEKARNIKDLWNKAYNGDIEFKAIEQREQLPAFYVNATNAYRCAKWLNGTLPNTDEWEKAAGRFHPSSPAGAYDSKVPREQLDVVVNKNKPSPVGTSKHDRSVYGCRDMSGNGSEWTRNILNVHGSSSELDRKNFEDFKENLILRGQNFRESEPFHFAYLESGLYGDYASFQRADESARNITFRLVINRQFSQAATSAANPTDSSN